MFQVDLHAVVEDSEDIGWRRSFRLPLSDIVSCVGPGWISAVFSLADVHPDRNRLNES